MSPGEECDVEEVGSWAVSTCVIGDGCHGQKSGRRQEPYGGHFARTKSHTDKIRSAHQESLMDQ